MQERKTVAAKEWSESVLSCGNSSLWPIMELFLVFSTQANQGN